MPKIYLTQTEQMKTKQFRMLERVLADHDIRHDKDVYQILGISQQCYSAKKKRKSITLIELLRIATRVGLSDDEIARIVKGE